MSFSLAKTKLAPYHVKTPIAFYKTILYFNILEYNAYVQSNLIIIKWANIYRMTVLKVTCDKISSASVEISTTNSLMVMKQSRRAAAEMIQKKSSAEKEGTSVFSQETQGDFLMKK